MDTLTHSVSAAPRATVLARRSRTPSLGTLPINVEALLQTRLLVQANSGGGKSYCLRRVLEQTASVVQQLVIDLEGEFSTLRERFDYVICAPHDADAVATPETAAALARALWESGASAIIDIYDLKAHERTLFVRRFCESLIAAPKRMWHPTLVVIDEAHTFAPQTGQAESAAAVIDLATRGRKRGLALVAATQRLSKLHKDVAAELINKLMGRTALDVDVMRAADELGMTRKEAWESLRTLEPGEFYGFGPALSPTVIRTRIGAVQTTHPTGGQRVMTPPPAPSPALRAKLAKLEGIQREAAKELTTVESLRTEVSRLTRDLAAARKTTVPKAAAADPGALKREFDRGRSTGYDEALAAVKTEVAGPLTQLAKQAGSVDAAVSRLLAKRPVAAKAAPAAPPAATERPAPSAAPVRAAKAPPPAARAAPAAGSVAEVSAPQQRILDALGWWAAAGVASPNRHQVAFVARYTVSGHFNNQVGALRALGLIDYPGNNRLSLTHEGASFAQAPAKNPSKAELIERVRSVLKGEPMRRIFDVLVEADGEAMTREDCATRSGYTVSGHFNNQVGALASIGVAEYPGKGMVSLGKAIAEAL